MSVAQSHAAAGPGPDHPRRANLSLILSLVHRQGTLSRAALTRTTGLNRSTVASLIARLAELGLVYESPAESSSGVGRPSPEVHAGDLVRAIAVNPEVDAVTIGVVSLSGRVIRKARYATEQAPSPVEVVNIAAAVIEGMRGDLEAATTITGIGVAVPGLVRSDAGIVTFAPHLRWQEVPLAEMLAEATGYQVWVANDASLGASAELVFGAGRGANDLVYLNGGASGIGGGVISRGSLRSGASGYAGELGHTLVDSAGHRCHCGAIGCLEAEVSLDRLQVLVGLRGADLDSVEAAIERMRSPAVEAEASRQLDVLAVALRNAVNAFNPERIILGGFLGTLHRLDPTRLEERIAAEALVGPAHDVSVRSAELGSDLLMIGAAELAFAELLDDPLRAFGT